MKRFALLLLSFSIAVGSVVSLAPKASATSVYDNVIVSGGSPEVKSSYHVGVGGCDDPKTFDGSGWAGFISDASNYHSSYVSQADNVHSALRGAIENGGGWAVNQYYSADGSNPSISGAGLSTCPDDTWLQILISDNKVATFQDNWGGHQLGMSGSWYVVVISASNDSTSSEKKFKVTEVTHGTGNSVTQGYSIAQGYAPQRTILNVFDVTYPDGYAGFKPPHTLFVATYSPRFTVNIEGKDVSIILCWVASQCSLPQGFGSNQGIGWSITDSSDDVVVSGSGKIIDMAIINTSVPNFGEYTVNVWYYAPIPFIQPEDELWNTMHLPIVVDGSTYFTGTGTQNCTDSGTCDAYTPYEKCFKPELPFIDLPACWHNLGVLGTLLSFDKIPMATNFNLGGSCRTLGTLGDWLGLTNKMVCPQFPSFIRDTVTPFVTFALALGVVSFIVTRTHANRTF